MKLGIQLEIRLPQNLAKERLGAFTTDCHYVNHQSERSPFRTRPLPSETKRCAGLQHCPGPVEFPKERFVARYRDAWSWVWSETYVGDKARNPFNFQLFNLKSLKLLVYGEEYPTPGIELEENGHVNGYNSHFLRSGTMHRGLQVESREGSNGYALFTWELNPDGSGSPAHLHPDYRGQITIKGVFTQGTDTFVTLIVYGEFVDGLNPGV